MLPKVIPSRTAQTAAPAATGDPRVSDTSKTLLRVSAVIAGLVAVASILDLALGFPFAGYSMMLDVCFLIGSLIVLYLAYDAWKDLR